MTSDEPESTRPAPSIHEAELATGPSGAVEYGADIDEAAAVARRKGGEDIVIRGDDTTANRALTYRIEAQVGLPSKPQFPHTNGASFKLQSEH